MFSLDMDIERILEKKVKPKAEKIDVDRRALKKGIRRLGRKKLLAVRVSKEYGGLDLLPREYFTFVEQLQSYSGALGFLQRQQQAAARFIFQSASDAFKDEWLPLMSKGKRSVGVSVSHLRSPSHPRVIGQLGEGGWYLKGEVSWVSGFRILDYLAVGFFIPSQKEEAMALIPFRKSKTLKITKPLHTVALSSLQTVNLQFKGHVVPEDRVFLTQPIGTYQKGSTILSVHFVNLSALALGLKRDCVENDLYEKLSQEYEICREAFLNRESDENLHPLYAQMHRIATEFCYLARFTRKTAALICPNSIERRYRELMLFGVIAADPLTAEACLTALRVCS